MIEIPDDVEKWTYGKIIDLINEGYDENDILELKRELNTDSERLIKTTCAFANTNGGTIIFGIDNNRMKSLHLNDRILGMLDSDQLKRNIIDKIKNIQPNIPIKNIIFRKSNLKIPHKKEVIVILKITPSNNKPHQYKHIFYKRLSDGNEPMDVTEVKQILLESQKNKSLLLLLRQECGLINDQLNVIKSSLVKNELYLAVQSGKNIHVDTIMHFMFNQSYLYSNDTTQTLMRIVEIIEKVSTCWEQYDNIKKMQPKIKSVHEKQLDLILNDFIDSGIQHFKELEKDLNATLIQPYTKEDLRKKVDELEKVGSPTNQLTS